MIDGLNLPRFYPILDSELLERRGMDILVAAESLLEAGAQIIQLRHKTHFSRDVFAQAERIAALCRDAGAMFIVNDRADMAMLLGAGLHVGQDDLPPSSARTLIGKGAILGFSTHNPVQLRAAATEPVDYLAFGPIFGTASKRNPDPVVGVDGLHSARSLTTLPLVAIGGITRATVHDVIDAGADSVAIIGDLLPEECSARSLRSRTEEWLHLLKNLSALSRQPQAL